MERQQDYTEEDILNSLTVTAFGRPNDNCSNQIMQKITRIYRTSGQLELIKIEKRKTHTIVRGFCDFDFIQIPKLNLINHLRATNTCPAYFH